VVQTLFVKCLPRTTVSRVWDCFFLEGTSFLFRTALALLDLLSPFVLGKSFEDTIQILTVSPTRKGVWALIHDGERRCSSQPVRMCCRRVVVMESWVMCCWAGAEATVFGAIQAVKLSQQSVAEIGVCGSLALRASLCV
jgi:hypothetical protein